MASKYTDKSGSIDLDKVAPKLSGAKVQFTVNKVKLSAPGKHMNDNTAIAGSIKNGVVRFSRCQPENIGNYSSVDTEAGKLHFGGNFVQCLKELVK